MTSLAPSIDLPTLNVHSTSEAQPSPTPAALNQSPSTSASTTPAVDSHKPKSKAFKAAFVSICFCNFASVLDTVIVAAALPAITHDLKAASNEAYWCGTGFLFAQAVSQPLYGALSNTFGRKPCLLFALSLFIVASIFCATAQSIEWLVVARVFQGLGAGGNNAMVSVIVTDMVTLHERGTYLGYISVASALASVSGSIIGAAIAGKSNWRIIFWINLPICIPAFIGILFFLHLELETGSMKSKLKKIDWIGMAMLTGPCVGLLYGITSGNVVYAWSSPQILSALIISAFGIAIFFLYEAKIPKIPMIPVRIFANRTSNGAYFGSFVMGFVLWAMQYYLLLYFLVSRRHSLLGSGVSMLPGTVTLPVSALAAGFIVTKTHKFKALQSVGWALITLGFGLVTTLSANSNGGKQFGYQIIYGFGGGIVFLSRLCAIQASQTDDDVGMATALGSFVTSLGQAFGVGIGGVIFQNQWSKRVSAAVTNKLLPVQFALGSQDAENAAALIKPFPLDIQSIYRDIMAQVIDGLFIVLTAFSGVAFLVSLLAKDLSLARESKSSQNFNEKKRAGASQNLEPILPSTNAT